ncbi:peptidoglycan editing factor PgeF [Marinilactibacillus psychrotolerans]|uniref:Purine nucleoside phosphorylase n=1 Tax=Marinilactibacillus psychrotolerans TaxID=191770 RepID=A0ABW8UHI2_9LACT
MQSKLLSEHGLKNYIAGTDYNFRYQKAGRSVKEDVQKVLSKMTIHPKEIYTGQQVHSANIAYVNGEYGDAFVFGKTFKETDGLITDQPNVALLIKFADCTPVVLFDPVAQVLASVHSGWRGTTQRISLKAIDKMVNDFKCKKENILVYLGPSIDIDHYEVGSEVYDAFETFENRDQFFRPIGKKYQLSMLDANLDILKGAGIRSENIEIEKASTFTDPRLHSARAEGPDYRLNGMLTMMKP